MTTPQRSRSNEPAVVAVVVGDNVVVGATVFALVDTAVLVVPLLVAVVFALVVTAVLVVPAFVLVTRLVVAAVVMTAVLVASGFAIESKRHSALPSILVPWGNSKPKNGLFCRTVSMEHSVTVFQRICPLTRLVPSLM